MSARTNEELAILAQKANREAEAELARRLESVIDEVHGSNWYASGWDRGDVRSRAYEGMLLGIRSWRPDGGMALENFVRMTIRRHIITQIIGTKRQKYAVLNGSLSLDEPIEFGEGHGGVTDLSTLIDIVEQPEALAALHDWVEVDEAAERIKAVYRVASPKERLVLDAMIADPKGNYAEWAEAAGLQLKAVDNAIMRLRHKAVDLEQQATRSPAPAETVPKPREKRPIGARVTKGHTMLLSRQQRAVLNFMSANPTANYTAAAEATGLTNQFAVSSALVRVRRKCAERGLVLDSDFTIRPA